MNVPDNCVKTIVLSPAITKRFDGENILGHMTMDLT